MARHKNVVWNLPDADALGNTSSESAQVAVLMDIRDELQTLNNFLSRHNFINIPNTLEGIRKKLPVRKYRKRKLKGTNENGSV